MRIPIAALLAVAPLAAGSQTPPPAAAPRAPTGAEAKAFAARVNGDLQRLTARQQTAEWIKSTYITDDTERNAAAMNEDLMAYLSEAVHASVPYAASGPDADTARMLLLLRVGQTLPAPADPAKRAELAAIAARLEGLYGKGKVCGPIGPARKGAPGAGAGPGCKDLQDLEEILAKSRDWDTLVAAWTGWHAVAREMRAPYERLVALGNEGAREIGFKDLGELWRAGYDMPPDAFEADTDRLWQEVKPFYDELHCYVRGRLQEVYGKARVPDGKPIPAHLLGNMWAQEWSNLYPLVEPYRNRASLDVDAALKAQRWDAVRMVKTGEAFFGSLGLHPLPKTFWERSMLVKPPGRDVVCHASAWDVTASGDLRIKMCVRPTEEDLVTIHHELGHNYYQRAYLPQPFLFQNGANDGFHEAIGDAIALSVTPAYLKRLGLVRAEPRDEKGTIDVQMKRALDKVAFLPWAKLVDQWRWDVFAGKVPPDRWVASWWGLRERTQGVAPPAACTEADFDPGAKYHVAANVPYTRYFLATFYQFQFHKALCDAAGWKGPLHACSVFGSKEAGAKLERMLEMGASRPWPEAYAALTGKTRADASALLEYFAPLRAWLQEQNRGKACGW
jgi:peptidyl-dipeptidase A